MKYQELLEGLTILELTSIYNALAPTKQLQSIEKFHTKPDGVKRLMWLINESRLTVQEIVKLIPEDTVRHKVESLVKEQDKSLNQRVTAAVRNTVPANVTVANAHKKIRIAEQWKGKNPKRKGSASYERFALYVDGMTVGDALKAGVTKADLAWDLKREFIRLED